MEDENNQQQPGQSFQPQQQPPYPPQQQAAQQFPQQTDPTQQPVVTPVQQYPQQVAPPQYDQSYPQQPVSQQQYSPDWQTQTASTGGQIGGRFNVKKILFILGGVVALFLFIFAIMQVVGGGSYELARVESSNGTYSVEMPVDWEHQSYDFGGGPVISRPPVEVATNPDPSQIAVSFYPSMTQAALIQEVYDVLDELESGRFVGSNSWEIENLKTSGDFEDEFPKISITFNAKQTNASYDVELKYWLVENLGAIHGSFTMSEDYRNLKSSIDTIMNSVQAN